MLTYPDIDRVAFSIGPLKVHWYGLMYLVGFAAGWWLARVRARRPGSSWTVEQVSDVVFYVALGAVLGGRIGYMLFYVYLPGGPPGGGMHFWEVWKGGMSFHGGLLGVMLAMWLYGRKVQKGFFQVADFVAPLVPIGLGAGRIGNFINDELWGRVSDLPWAMVSPATGGLARHPTQLYEAFLEGLVLFILLWLYSRRARPTMAVSGMFLLFYGSFRFLVEFVRSPDAHIGYLAFKWFTMGMLLTLPMILAGAGLVWWAYRRQIKVRS